MDIDYNELDPECIPLVKFFNENGLSTIMSCQGHNTPNMSMFWIQFSKEVTEDDIMAFQSRFSTHWYNIKTGDEADYFPSAGSFVKRLWYGSKGNYSRYRYEASNVEAALYDLKKWQNKLKDISNVSLQ